MRTEPEQRKWKYGKDWENFPIREGETWCASDGSRVTCLDWIRSPRPSWLSADMIYTDPPWNIGLLKSFFTKTEVTLKEDDDHDFDVFTDTLFFHIKSISPRVAFVEIGKQYVGEYEARVKQLFPIVDVYGITYHKTEPCYLLRGSYYVSPRRYEGLDDGRTPYFACEAEQAIKAVVDLCTGRGLTAKAAHKNDMRFFGSELNERRLAHVLTFWSKQGLNPVKL